MLGSEKTSKPSYKTLPIINYMGLRLRVVGTFRTLNGWEHDVQNIETGEVKRKSDAWVMRIQNK